MTTLLLKQTPANAAIFSGGPGDGNAAHSSGSSDLNGNVGRSHRFTGGPSDGYSAKTTIYTPPASIDNWQRYNVEKRK